MHALCWHALQEKPQLLLLVVLTRLLCWHSAACVLLGLLKRQASCRGRGLDELHVARLLQQHTRTQQV
jgi:hypothetical protein